MHYGIIYGYDALMTIAHAIRDADSTDPIAIRDAMLGSTSKGCKAGSSSRPSTSTATKGATRRG